MLERPLHEWLSDFRVPHSECLFYLIPEDSLLKGIRSLCSQQIHRIPVIDLSNKNPIFLLSHKKILNFLCEKAFPTHSVFEKTLLELNVGKYSELVTVTLETPLENAVKLFLSHRISSLPVLDAYRRPVYVYSKADIINLALDKFYLHPHYTVRYALDQRSGASPVLICGPSATLFSVVQRLAAELTPRMLVTDEEGRLIGIVSLSDISNFLITQLEPPV